MKPTTLKSDFILFFAATIWGLGFVAQRAGMEHIGPFTFNGIRFALGGLSLLPIIILKKNPPAKPGNGLLQAGLVSGVFLFFGISFQQVGIVYTTAGKAGFITGLYVVIVPFLSLFFKQDKPSAGTWTGVALASIGMYLLCVTQGVSINPGDVLVLISAVCFAFHLIIIGRLSHRFNTEKLALAQCFVCAIFSLGIAGFLEAFILEDIIKVTIPLLYGGILSVGVAYSLQIYGQKNSPASHAAIILSLESAVAAIGGWLILNEILTNRAIVGCVLMLSGMLVSQLFMIRAQKKHH